MNTVSQSRGQNDLLNALHGVDFDLIRPRLTHEMKAAGDVIYQPGDDIGRVYFPLGPSLVSYLVNNFDGETVQTILVGREGAVGGIVSSGGLPAYCLISVKVGGSFFVADVAKIQSAKDSSASFRRLFERYSDCLMAQIFQATACNAVHSVEQRAAKWILEEADRAQETVVHLSHEELASRLGVGRSYVTRVLRSFVAEGALKTAREAITILDRTALEQKSCGCNQHVESHFGRVLRGIY